MDEGLNMSEFVAQNTSNARSRSRKSSKKDQVTPVQEIDPEDEDLIKRVTEPITAKTKAELLGKEPPPSGRGRRRSGSKKRSKKSPASSRVKNRSRSRSKSKSKERKSGRSSRQKQTIPSKHGTLLNEVSNHSLDKDHQLMNLATIGDQHDVLVTQEGEVRNLALDNTKNLNNCSSSNFRRSRYSAAGSTHSNHNQHSPAYEDEHTRLSDHKRRNVNDDEFIKKVQEFSQIIDKKKLSYQQ